MPEPQVMTKLPDNAYRELKPGETYVPMVPPNVSVPEVTTRSIIFGLAMNIIFSNLQKDMFRRFLRQSATRAAIVELLDEADQGK